MPNNLLLQKNCGPSGISIAKGKIIGMKKAIFILIFFLSQFLMFAESVDGIQFVKDNRIKWRSEEFIDELIEKAQLAPEDDFIFLEEFGTDFSCGLVLLKNRTFYFFDIGVIKQKKLKDSVVKKLSEMILHDTIKNDIGARDKSYYNVFIKTGETLTFALFDNAIDDISNDKIIEQDRQTVVEILDLLGLGIYHMW